MPVPLEPLERLAAAVREIAARAAAQGEKIAAVVHASSSDGLPALFPCREALED